MSRYSNDNFDDDKFRELINRIRYAETDANRSLNHEYNYFDSVMNGFNKKHEEYWNFDDDKEKTYFNDDNYGKYEDDDNSIKVNVGGENSVKVKPSKTGNIHFKYMTPEERYDIVDSYDK